MSCCELLTVCDLLRIDITIDESYVYDILDTSPMPDASLATFERGLSGSFC